MIGFDVETLLIKPGRLAPPLVCAAFAWPDGSQLLRQVGERELRDEVLHLVATEDLIVGHNVAFDMSVVCAEWPDLIPIVFEAYEQDRIVCTEVREKLIAIAQGNYRFMHLGGGVFRKLVYSLDECCELRLGIKLDKSWQEKFCELAEVPISFWPPEAVDYAQSDALATLAVYQHQEMDAKYLEDQFRQARAAFWIQLMACWGLTTSEEDVREFARKTQREYDQIEAELRASGMIKPDGVRNTKIVQTRVRSAYAKLKKKVPSTPRGKVCTDADTCSLSGDPLLKKYSDLSSLKKTLSTDVPLLREAMRVPLKVHFEVLLETGRTSSSPNVQNLPTDVGVRECFCPRHGHVYAVGDYSGAELRTWSQVCYSVLGKSHMRDALLAGVDPHIELARRILGISYEEALADYKRDPMGKVYKPRQASKAGNFGFPGGLGPKTFVEYARSNYGVALHLTDDEAREHGEPASATALREFWFGAWGESREYLEWVGLLVDYEDPQIRHPCSHRYRGRVSFTEAANGFFQALAADMAKAAGFLIARACYAEPESILYGSRIVNFIHDEFVLEVLDDEFAADKAEELARLMVEGALPFLPDVPPVVEPLLTRKWSKKAKPVRDSQGRLVPWDFPREERAA